LTITKNPSRFYPKEIFSQRECLVPNTAGTRRSCSQFHRRGVCTGAYHLKSDQAKKRSSSAHDNPPGTRHELAHDTAQAAARAPKWKVHAACATCESGDREFERFRKQKRRMSRI
jgi:hypothetical protein